ncbi:MAG: hypothetical protein WDN76_00225 [Alphaproteobacteria bacterium]
MDPIRPDLTAIDDAADKAALAPILGKLVRTSATIPFQGYVDINPKDRRSTFSRSCNRACRSASAIII